MFIAHPKCPFLLSSINRNGLKDFLCKIKVDSKLLEEAALTKQARAHRHRIRETNIKRYRLQTSHCEIDAMEVRNFFRAGYTLECQLWRRFDFKPKHATNIRMEQADVSA